MNIEITTTNEAESLRLFRKGKEQERNILMSDPAVSDTKFLQDWIQSDLQALVKQGIEIEGQALVIDEKAAIDVNVKQTTNTAFVQLALDVKIKSP